MSQSSHAAIWRPVLQPYGSTAPRVLPILAYYTAMSGSLLVINKATISMLHAPVFILFMQLAFATIGVRLLAAAGIVRLEAVPRSQLAKFFPLVVGFLGTLYCNIKVLQVCNWVSPIRQTIFRVCLCKQGMACYCKGWDMSVGVVSCICFVHTVMRVYELHVMG